MLTATPEYSVTKGAVVTLTEVLSAQLQDAGSAIGASVLFPGPHMLRTGLFESWRNRPAELAKEKPRRATPSRLEEFEKLMRDAGVELQYTPVEEVAGRVVDAIRAGDFWILPPSERADEQIRARPSRCSSARTPPTSRRSQGDGWSETRACTATSSSRRDCHAGLPNEQYRDWLDPEHRDAFDAEHRGTRGLECSSCAQRGILNEEFAEEWERENEEGLRGGWDAARRDKELDADGVVGEVIFPDADAVTVGRVGAVRRRARRRAATRDPELLMAGARAHNRWLAELCAD